jgi:hypothetical protein
MNMEVPYVLGDFSEHDDDRDRLEGTRIGDPPSERSVRDP